MFDQIDGVVKQQQSRNGSGNQAIIESAKAVRENVAGPQFAEQEGVQSQGRLPPAMADGEQIRQVLINLITNAAESMIVGGEVHLMLSADRDETGTGMVVVRVRDVGQGMPSEVQARIYEPFFTTKDGGTGLGLCIAAQIMARHGGRLALESSSAAGSCFAIWIPTADEGHYAENSNR